MTDESCEWTYTTYFDTWEASCGTEWQFTAGPPRANDVHYCPSCGRPLVEVDAPVPTNPLRAKVVARGDEDG